jgi:Ca2+-binding EF-hand superfamily protein
LKGYYFFFIIYIIFVFYLELRQAFDLFDSDKSGSISVNELKQALGAMGVNITDQEAQEMFSAIDVDSN